MDNPSLSSKKTSDELQSKSHKRGQDEQELSFQLGEPAELS
jgi:hypothetical protein